MSDKPQSAAVRTLKRYTDWRGWFVGMYVASVPVSIGKVLDWLTTNGVEATGVKAGIASAAGVGITLKQLTITFIVAIGVSALQYVRTKPRPDVVERPGTPAPFNP